MKCDLIIISWILSSLALLSPGDGSCLSFRGKTFNEDSLAGYLSDPHISPGGDAFVQQNFLPDSGYSLTVGKLRGNKIRFSKISDTHPSITNGAILGVGDNGAVVGVHLSEDQETCEVRQYTNDAIHILHSYSSTKGPSPVTPVCTKSKESAPYAVGSSGDFVLASKTTNPGDGGTDITVVRYAPGEQNTVLTKRSAGTIRELILSYTGRQILVRIDNSLIVISSNGSVSEMEIPEVINGMGGPSLLSGPRALFSGNSNIEILNTKTLRIQTIPNFSGLSVENISSPVFIQSSKSVITSEGVIRPRMNKLFQSGNLAKRFSDIKGYGVLKNGQVLAHFWSEGVSNSGEPRKLGLITIQDR